MSESVNTIVGELRKYSELVLFGNVGWENSRKMIGVAGPGWAIALSNKIRLLGLESY